MSIAYLGGYANIYVVAPVMSTHNLALHPGSLFNGNRFAYGHESLSIFVRFTPNLLS